MANIAYTRPAQGAAISALSKASTDTAYGVLTSVIYDMTAFAEARFTISGVTGNLSPTKLPLNVQTWSVGQLGRFIQVYLNPTYNPAVSTSYPIAVTVVVLSGDSPNTLAAVQSANVNYDVIIPANRWLESFALLLTPTPNVTQVVANGDQLDSTTGAYPVLVGGLSEIDATPHVLPMDARGYVPVVQRYGNPAGNTGTTGVKTVTDTPSWVVSPDDTERRLTYLRIQNVGANPLYFSILSSPTATEPNSARYDFQLPGNSVAGSTIELRDLVLLENIGIRAAAPTAQTSTISVMAMYESYLMDFPE